MRATVTSLRVQAEDMHCHKTRGDVELQHARNKSAALETQLQAVTAGRAQVRLLQWMHVGVAVWCSVI